MFGDEVCLNYKGTTTHKSFGGGIISIIGAFLIVLYVTYGLLHWHSEENVIIKSYTEFMGYEAIGQVKLKNNDFDFIIYLTDPEFDNDNNPYG